MILVSKFAFYYAIAIATRIPNREVIFQYSSSREQKALFSYYWPLLSDRIDSGLKFYTFDQRIGQNN